MAQIHPCLGLFIYIVAQAALHVSGQVITAVVDESVNIVAHEACTTKGKLAHMLKTGSSVTVATVTDGVLTPGEKYGDRILNSSSGFLLTRVTYNDNGLYGLTCGPRAPSYFKLQVLSVNNNSVSEGDTVKLPCYSSTLDEPVRSVWWEKNQTLVLKLNVSGEVEHGAGFDGRASLSSDWKLTGDLSLILEGSQLEDAGDYSCSVLRNEAERVHPAVERLTVHRETPPTCPLWTTAATVVTIVTTVLALVVITGSGLLVWKLKNKLPACPQCHRPEADVEQQLPTNNNVNEGQEEGEPKESTGMIKMNGHTK